MKDAGFLPEPVPWYQHAFIVRGITGEALARHPLVEEGKIYQQSLSSMIPAVVLGVLAGEKVLDACAAPGSKTTQMAAMMQGRGVLVAVEAVKVRFFRLKAVCALLAADNVSVKLCDVRRYRPADERLFDRVLVDAPCSSEGRFRDDDPATTHYWSLRKIKEMSFKQKGILMSAARLLRPGGTLVYSTCTLAPEENEEVVDWFLRKTGGSFKVLDATVPGITRTPCLAGWGRNVFHEDVLKCLRVKPEQGHTPFFIAKFIKEDDGGEA